MTSTTYSSNTAYADPKAIYFEKQIDQICQNSVLQFKKIQRFYLKFHSFFLSGIVLELFAFGFLFHYFPKSSILALFISGIFLTIFSHVVLLSYFQVKKPQQFAQLKEDFVNRCKSLIEFEPGTNQYHFSFSYAFHHLVCKLTITDEIAEEWIKKSEIFAQIIFKWRIWTEWKDLLKIKELLLSSAIEEHIALIKLEPTDLEAHASLANIYRIFSKLYVDPQKLAMNELVVWMPRRYYSDELFSKSQQFLQRALQELLILNEYAVGDPWVHAQLATIYEELKMPDKEIAEYEKILAISPEEKEVIYRLGVCYFLQGQNAKGLRMYSLLKSHCPSKAPDLINYYDAYR
jgi:tetratricopeptide (TPR) repeat protein